jgi:TonB family protein
VTGLPGVVLFAVLTVSSPQVARADSIETVRQLYASAEYESALAALDRVTPTADSAEITEVERYRALCLMALGRTSDAEVAIERLVRQAPDYVPDEQEPPRVRAAFATVRTRVLPDVVRGLYASAKAAYDRKDYAAAVPGFARVIEVIGSVESADATVTDLGTLASGFMDLSKAALAASAPPPVPAADPVPPPPTPAEPEPAPVEPTTGPEVIQQVLPEWNIAWTGSQYQAEFRGTVEVVIDESGVVTEARIVDAVHPAYDALLLEAATRWRYRPAQQGGKPVTSTKRVNIVLRPRE